jgi:hypothetical protein
MIRPCKLQINVNGAWRDVLRFDLDKSDADTVQTAAANLVLAADPDGRTSLRITMADVHQSTLVRWDRQKGWVKA